MNQPDPRTLTAGLNSHPSRVVPLTTIMDVDLWLCWGLSSLTVSAPSTSVCGLSASRSCTWRTTWSRRSQRAFSTRRRIWTSFLWVTTGWMRPGSLQWHGSITGLTHGLLPQQHAFYSTFAPIKWFCHLMAKCLWSLTTAESVFTWA